MLLLVFLLILRAVGLKLPGSCDSGQFYDSTVMNCRSCNTNHSMVPSDDGFGCTCASGSIPFGISKCKPCNSTELISEDGTVCVPRRCQKSGGRVVCRKCPNDYIAVTQNFDGSPMKEVTCFKCARGYKVKDNKCVKCEACICSKSEVVVSGTCLPKKYVVERPKYNDNKLHPSSLLEIVKLEYFCNQSDLRSCHALAKMCVSYFYTSDPAGPCRLWIQPNATHKVTLPQLVLNESIKNNVIDLSRGMAFIKIAALEYSSTGALDLIQEQNQRIPCLRPLLIKLGEDYSQECLQKESDLESIGAYGKTYEFYIPEQIYKPLAINLLKPNGQYVQKSLWPSGRFRKFFFIDNVLSITANTTTTVYLRKIIFILRVERKQSGSLDVHISIETHYATKSPISQEITTSLVVKHEMVSAGVLWGLQVWGGVLSTVLAIYAIVQWRGVVHRGGMQISILPILSGCVADGLYFAALLSTMHALAAEAGTLGVTLPLSQNEENIIKAFTIAVLVLKIIKVAWINWKQCQCDIFFIDWSQYNPPVRDSSKNNNTYYDWRSVLLAREWMGMQTARRVSPVATITFTLLILQILDGWQSYLPKSEGYTWVIGSLSWWLSYTIIFSVNWIKHRFFTSPTSRLAKICSGVEMSLLVFQEEYYAHYVHGRSDEGGGSLKIPGPLATCRLVCAPQVRIVYKKLANTQYGLGDNESNRILLSRFLAAFFERALDGLNWVAIERTILERLLDVELTNREGNNTSTLLYDLDSNIPSCFAVTWWGEEWTLATFDAMLFGCILLATGHVLMATLITLLLWQIMKQIRQWFAHRNLRNKTDIEVV
ncbi:unnamed protein product [Colias eurytheme]|nr:unnamed protein product [Colias eurytheme]